MTNAEKVLQSCSGADGIDVPSCTDAVEKLDASGSTVEAASLRKDLPVATLADDLRECLQVFLQAVL